MTVVTVLVQEVVIMVPPLEPVRYVKKHGVMGHVIVLMEWGLVHN